MTFILEIRGPGDKYDRGCVPRPISEQKYIQPGMYFYSFLIGEKKKTQSTPPDQRENQNYICNPDKGLESQYIKHTHRSVRKRPTSYTQVAKDTFIGGTRVTKKHMTLNLTSNLKNASINHKRIALKKVKSSTMVKTG